MPRAATELPESYNSIVRPVIHDVLDQLTTLLELPRNIKLLIPDPTGSAIQTDSMLQLDPDEPVGFRNKDQLRVEVNESVVEERVYSTAVNQAPYEHDPIFLDPKLGVSLTPVYAHSQLMFEVVYRAENRVLARRFKENLELRAAMMRRENQLELNYHYQIPPMFVHLLKYLHGLRESVAPYGEDLGKWVSDHITEQATNLTTLIGTEPALSIREHQVAAFGHFDFTAQPVPEQKDNEAGAYNVSFQYTVFFDKVIAVNGIWPLVVHNQLIEFPWVESPNASGEGTTLNRRLTRPSRSRAAMNHFSVGVLDACEMQPKPVRIPEFDEWFPATERPGLLPVGDFMLQVNEDPRQLFNFETDMLEYDFHPDVLAFLKTEGPALARYTDSLFHFTLYRGDEPLDPSWLTVDNDLNIRTTRDLDLRTCYHLRFSVVSDPLILTDDAIERLRKAGRASKEALTAVQWRVLRDAYIPNLVAGHLLSRADFQHIAQRLRERFQTEHGIVSPHSRNQVGLFTIMTKRIEDHDTDATQGGGTAGADSRADSGHYAPVPRCDG